MNREAFLRHIKDHMPDDIDYIADVIEMIASGENIKSSDFQMAMRLAGNFYLDMQRTAIWKDGGFRGCNYKFSIPAGVNW